MARINIYSEEITDRVEIVHKGEFTGVRFYMELPVALQTPPVELGGQPGISHIKGPFVHHAGDDDSSAVTFWGKREFLKAMKKAIALLEPNNLTASQASTVGEAQVIAQDSNRSEYQFTHGSINMIDAAISSLGKVSLTPDQARRLRTRLDHLETFINP